MIFSEAACMRASTVGAELDSKKTEFNSLRIYASESRKNLGIFNRGRCRILVQAPRKNRMTAGRSLAERCDRGLIPLGETFPHQISLSLATNTGTVPRFAFATLVDGTPKIPTSLPG